MARNAAVVLTILALVFSVSPAHSYTEGQYPRTETSYHPEDDGYMTGDWGDVRDRIADRGVTFASSYTLDILGNVSGGRERGARYDSSMGWDVNFDLDKFAGLDNTQFRISGLWRQGRNLSSDTIGNSMVTSSIYGHEQFRFYFLYFEKTFLDNRINIRAGRIAAGDDFAASPLYWTYLNNGIDGCPITIPINLFFTVYPTTTWGVRAKVNIAGDLNMISGLYNGDPGVQRDCMYGLDFSMRLNKGLFYAQEFSYNPNTKPEAKGMPGNYKAGFYYHSGVFRDVYYDVNGASAAASGRDKMKHVGNYGLYFHADQLIYREKGTKDQGLTPLFVSAIAPDNLNQFSLFLMAGLIYKGLVPGFDQDLTAAQVICSKWGDQWSRNISDGGGDPKSREIVLEFTYKKYITKWMYLQPDLQYIIRPGGTGKTKDALVIGTRFGVSF